MASALSRSNQAAMIGRPVLDHSTNKSIFQVNPYELNFD